jgi:predicted transcriptional regulator
MSYPQARKYLAILMEGGLIEEEKKSLSFNLRRHYPFTKPKRVVQTYYLTEKGKKFVHLHKKILELMPPEMVPSFELLSPEVT